MWYYHYWISLWIWCHKSSTCRKQHNGGKYITFFINLFIEEKSNEFITIFFGVIPFNDKKIYIYLLMQAGLQIISMQIRSKKGRTISFQWCMEISTQRLLKHSTAYLIHQHKSEWIPVLKGTNYTFRVLCLNFQPKKLYKICISKPWILF
jgi:hypothetical protein